jgi:hypothetical protein
MSDEELTWGPWRYEPKDKTLEAEGGYRLALDGMTSCEVITRTIMQFASKEYITDARLGALVRAIGDMVDPLQHLCPLPDQSRTLTSEQMAWVLNHNTVWAPLKARARATASAQRCRVTGLRRMGAYDRALMEETLALSPEDQAKIEGNFWLLCAREGVMRIWDVPAGRTRRSRRATRRRSRRTRTS